MRRLLGLLPLLLVSTVALAQDSAWAGTWTLNIAQSKLHGPPPKSETVQIDAPGGPSQHIGWAISGRDADGAPIDITFQGKADGSAYPEMANGKEIAQQTWRRRSSHRYFNTATMHDGTTSTASYLISGDGKQFTIREHVTGPKGTYEVLTVWDKSS